MKKKKNGKNKMKHYFLSKRNTLRTLTLSAVLATALPLTGLAAGWQSDGTNYWWANDDGTYPTNKWEWLDGNNDGVSECYYFDTNGYLLVNTTTPDGCKVNADGAWVIDGVVQIQTAQSQSTQTQQNKTASYGNYSINPLIFEEMTVPSKQVYDKYGPELLNNGTYFNPDAKVATGSSSTSKKIYLNGPAFKEYTAYLWIKPKNGAYRADYDIYPDGSIDANDAYRANRFLGNAALAEEISDYIYDTSYYDWERPMCKIVATGNVMVGFADKTPVEEMERILRKMGASNFETVNHNYQSEIIESLPGRGGGELSPPQ